MAVSTSRSLADPSLVAVRASRLAREIHAGQTDRYGDPLLEHVARVAARVPAEARSVALVHDVCERSRLSPTDVACRVGLAEHERIALELLTARTDEDVVAHTERIVAAPPGPARDLALVVKRADVGDHTDRAPLDHGTPHARAAAALAPDAR